MSMNKQKNNDQKKIEKQLKKLESMLIVYLQEHILQGQSLGKIFAYAYQSVIKETTQEQRVLGYQVTHYIFNHEEFFRDNFDEIAEVVEVMRSEMEAV